MHSRYGEGTRDSKASLAAAGLWLSRLMMAAHHHCFKVPSGSVKSWALARQSHVQVPALPHRSSMSLRQSHGPSISLSFSLSSLYRATDPLLAWLHGHMKSISQMPGSQQRLISSLAFWPLLSPLAKQFQRCPPHGWQRPEHTRHTGDKHRVQAPDSDNGLFWGFNCSSGGR